MKTRGVCVLAFVSAATVGSSGIDGSTQKTFPGSAIYALVLDGTSVGFVSAASGGAMVADAVAESTGKSGSVVKKHPSPARVEPLILEVEPLGMAPAFHDWVAGALAGKPAARAAALLTYDVSLKEVGRLTFTNLRVTEVTLPALDGSSKEPASLTVTAQADSVAREKPSATPGTAKAKVGRLLESNFKLTMPGLDGTRVAKVSAITVKVSAGRVEVSNFTVALSEAAAEAWLQWHDLFIVQGKSTDQNEKTADIELLDATLKNTLMRIHLDGVGILRASSAQEGGANAIRRLVAELYAEGIRLEVK